ncbi:hypothetical protein ACN28E_22470 [Archangium lansingense]|uniref:hypothetical protein n=1 Tax=Archangium lansingense TaxID=2995310 RepID=UPI003B8044EC
MRRRWSAVGVLIAALLGGVWPFVSVAQPAPRRPVPTVSHNIPIDVDVPFANPEDNLPFFDDFSWREFIALTWPARLGARGPYPRGSPDIDRKYGDVSVPTVWETWKADFELFLPGGAAPADWRSFASPSPCDARTSLVPYQKVLGSFDAFHGFNQAFAGPLVSQNRQYVRYETRVNRAGYQFILEPGGAHPGPLYLAANLPGNGTPHSALRFPSGSVLVKASWRVMTGVPEAQRKHYYVTRANLLDPLTGRCSVTDVGLIGLHIVNKPPSFPRWIWSSFEHVDNVPDSEGGSGRGAFPFALNDNAPATPPSPQGEPISRCNPPQRDPAPTQVVRKRPLAASTRLTNHAYHQAEGVKGTVWENYQLVMTQWPLGDGTSAFPSLSQPQTNTANVSLETWFQDSADSSCMACHGRANQRQYDFVWFLPLGAHPRKPAPCSR